MPYGSRIRAPVGIVQVDIYGLATLRRGAGLVCLLDRQGSRDLTSSFAQSGCNQDAVYYDRVPMTVLAWEVTSGTFARCDRSRLRENRLSVYRNDD